MEILLVRWDLCIEQPVVLLKIPHFDSVVTLSLDLDTLHLAIASCSPRRVGRFNKSQLQLPSNTLNEGFFREASKVGGKIYQIFGEKEKDKSQPRCVSDPDVTFLSPSFKDRLFKNFPNSKSGNLSKTPNNTPRTSQEIVSSINKIESTSFRSRSDSHFVFDDDVRVIVEEANRDKREEESNKPFRVVPSDLIVPNYKLAPTIGQLKYNLITPVNLMYYFPPTNDWFAFISYWHPIHLADYLVKLRESFIRKMDSRVINHNLLLQRTSDIIYQLNDFISQYYLPNSSSDRALRTDPPDINYRIFVKEQSD